MVEQELAAVVAAVPHPVVVHCCAPRAPIGLLRAAGADAVSVDVGLVQDLDARRRGGRGAAPTCCSASCRAPTRRCRRPKATASRVSALWNELGFPVERLPAAVTLTPACGLAGATPGYARAAMAHVREAAKYLQPE